MDFNSVTNEHIIEKTKSHGLDATTKDMLKTYQLNSSWYKAMLGVITRTHQKYQQLNKSKSRVKGKESLEQFLKSSFQKPSYDSEKCGKENIETVRSEPFADTDDLSLQTETFKSVAGKLAGELIESKHEIEALEEELELTINEKDMLNEHLEINSQKLDSQRKTLKRTVNRESYWREKYLKIDHDINETTANEIQSLKMKIHELKQQWSEKNREITKLKEVVDELNVENIDLKKIDNMILFDEDKNCYISQLHACVYSLLDYQVSCENVSNVIESVLKLCNKTANRLPSVSTVNNWSIERGLIARRQIVESCDHEHTTLHTDEASKYGDKWGAFATRDKSGNYLLLGLRDMATKSSGDTLDTFKEILSDIDAASDRDDSAANRLLCNIKNTMSDRASTETKFNEMLKEYRDTVLPDVILNFNMLNEESKQAITEMNNFFCGLHTLVHMADVSQHSIFEVEKAHFDGNIPIDNPSFSKNGQSGTVRLILTACKSFARRGDQKNGCHGAFVTFVSDFLKSNKLLGLPLQPLRGNRFNILFSNAGHVYFLRNKMQEFLEKTSLSNGLLQSVLKDLKTPFFIAGCKALGLISKLITTPLWNVIENKNVSISQMNEKYLRLMLFLNEATENIDEFMKGNLILFDDVPLKKDIVYDALVAPFEHDEFVVIILSVVVPALAKLIKKQYVDHLPGGKNEILNPNETASVDKHNKYPERVFSYVDHVLSVKPNIKTLALEAHIAFSLNKTSDWLANQENSVQIIEQSRAEVQLEKKRFKQREEIIKAKRIEKQEEDFRRKQEQERRRIERLEKETNDMLFYGLWQTQEQVEEELSKINAKTEKESALKVQLRFRKNVFQQKCEKPNVYAFSKQVDGKRCPLTIEELKENVLALIQNSYQIPPPEQSHFLVDKEIKHRWIDNGQSRWYNGKVISQVPGFPQWFNVLYENDDAIYTAKLLDDYKVGDVLVSEKQKQ